MLDEENKKKKQSSSMLEWIFKKFGVAEEWKKKESGSTLLLILFIIFTLGSCALAYLAVYYVSSKNQGNEIATVGGALLYAGVIFVADRFLFSNKKSWLSYVLRISIILLTSMATSLALAVGSFDSPLELAVRNESIEGRQRAKYKSKVDSIDNEFTLKIEDINLRMINDIKNNPDNSQTITVAYQVAKNDLERRKNDSLYKLESEYGDMSIDVTLGQKFMYMLRHRGEKEFQFGFWVFILMLELTPLFVRVAHGGFYEWFYEEEEEEEERAWEEQYD